MHTQYPMIEEDNENWIVWLCLDLRNKCFLSSRIFENLHICRTDYKKQFMFWKCGLNRFQLILKIRMKNLDHTIKNTLSFEFNGSHCTELR
jgi:hypothetical protein